MNITSCDTVQDFWLAWAPQGIYIGKGNVLYQQMALSYNSTNVPDVATAALATGMGSPGDWQIPLGRGK